MIKKCAVSKGICHFIWKKMWHLITDMDWKVQFMRNFEETKTSFETREKGTNTEMDQRIGNACVEMKKQVNRWLKSKKVYIVFTSLWPGPET